MNNGQFWCKKCADIPKVIRPEIDADEDNIWKIQTFTTNKPDRDFDNRVNQFLSTLDGYEVKTNSCVTTDTFILTIMYRRK